MIGQAAGRFDVARRAGSPGAADRRMGRGMGKVVKLEPVAEQRRDGRPKRARGGPRARKRPSRTALVLGGG
ncbi:MAG: hypothetical protein QOD61_257, partial [Solirubrobacteraceae bacterium]|nr:hypothetical protein [Solirubrobacteraceae bacterium]